MVTAGDVSSLASGVWLAKLHVYCPVLSMEAEEITRVEVGFTPVKSSVMSSEII